MRIPQYTPGRQQNRREILNNHPEIAKQLEQQDQWSQYERGITREECSSEEWRMLPDSVKDGQNDGRIDAWMITK